jgi:hypothetical protein
MEEKIQKATELLEAEGYLLKHNYSPFALIQGEALEKDGIKSYVRLEDRVKFERDLMFVRFGLVLRKYSDDRLITNDFRKIAEYMEHLCDVADELNDLEITVKRDIREPM